MSRILSALALAVFVILPLNGAPAQAAGRLPFHTVSVDVDGDQLPDRVAFYHLSSTQFLLRVTTATLVSEVTISSTYLLDRVDDTPWWGAGDLDPVAGKELLVRTWADQFGWGFNVYTWRSGKVVAERAPESPVTRGWYVGGDSFFTERGVRYVEVSNLHADLPGDLWDAIVIRSRWSNGAWVKVSERHFIANPEVGNYYIGLSGVDLIS